MKQKRIVCFSLRRNSKPGIPRVGLLVLGIPRLGIGRIGNNSIYIERVVGMYRVVLVEVRPVLLQRIAVSGHDVVRQDSPHDQVHSCEVIGILLQLLCIVHNMVAAAHVPCNALADIDQQGAGAAGGVVDFNFRPVFQVVGNDFGHQK